MKATQLEEAIEARNECDQIIEFLTGYAPGEGSKGWEGRVALSFGNYECNLSNDVKDDLLALLYKQRSIYLKKLRDWGIEQELQVDEKE